MSDIVEKYAASLTAEPEAPTDADIDAALSKTYGALKPEEPPQGFGAHPDAVALAQGKQPEIDPNTTPDAGTQAVQAIHAGTAKILQNMYNNGANLYNEYKKTASKNGIDPNDFIKNVDFGDKLDSPNDTSFKRIVEGVFQYGAPQAALYAMGAGALGTLVGGALIDMVTMDPRQDRLSNLIKDKAPELAMIPIVGNVLDYTVSAAANVLASKPDDSTAVGMAKQGAESSLLIAGSTLAMVGGVYGITKVIRAGQKISNAAKAMIYGTEHAVEAGAEVVPHVPGTSAATSAEAIPAVAGENTPVTAPISTPNATDGVVPPSEAPSIAATSEAAATEKTPSDLFNESPILENADGSVRPNIHDEKYAKFVQTQTAAEQATGKARGEPMEWNNLTEEQKAMAKDPKQVERIIDFDAARGDRPYNDNETKVAAYLMDNAHQDVIAKVDAHLANNTDESAADLANSIRSFTLIDSAQKEAGSMAGRAFQSRKLITDTSGMTLSEFQAHVAKDGQRQWLSGVIDHGGGRETLDQIALKIKLAQANGVNPREALSKAADSFIKKFADNINGIALNSMMSRPLGVLAAFISKMSNTFRTIETNFTAGLVADAFNAEGFSLKQQGKYISTMMASSLEAIHSAGRMLIGRESLIYKNAPKLAFNNANPIANEVFGSLKSSNPILNGIYEVVKGIANAGSRMHASANELFQLPVYRGNLGQQVQEMLEGGRATSATGKRIAKDLASGLTPEQVANKYIATPTMEMHLKADAFAKKNMLIQTLNPEGIKDIAKAPTGALLQEVVRRISPFGLDALTVPFFKITANITQYGIEHSPFVLLQSETRDMLARGGNDAALATAKMINGSTFLAHSTYLGWLGVTTRPETDNYRVTKALNEQSGFQTDSLRIPGRDEKGNLDPEKDRYISFSRLGNTGSMLRLGHVLSSLRNYNTSEDYEKAVTLAVTGLVDFVSPEQMFAGMSSIMEALNESAKYGEDNGHKISAVASEIAMRFVPLMGMQKGIKDLMDPYKRSIVPEKNDNAGPFEDFIDRFVARYKSNSPFYSKDVPIDRNSLGEPIMIPHGVANTGTEFPMAEKDGRNSKVMANLKLLAQVSNELTPGNPDLPVFKPTNPSRVFNASGVKVNLPNDMYEKYQIACGGRNPDTDEPWPKEMGKAPELRAMLEPLLEKEIDLMKNKKLNEEVYKGLVGTVTGLYSTYRAIGDGWLFQQKDFQELYQKSIRHAIENKDMDPTKRIPQNINLGL